MIKILAILTVILLSSCSFDYGEGDGSARERPDIVMENLVYVRVRSGDPTARFSADRAERFEQRQRMDILRFTFEQFGQDEHEVNALGRAGSASVEIDTGNIRMRDWVRLEVESEDFTIETYRLDWRDRDRTLLSGADEEVMLSRSNGTTFVGFGFRADARMREWEFSGGVRGRYIHNEDEEDTWLEDIF